jgi:hypothetical protein
MTCCLVEMSYKSDGPINPFRRLPTLHSNSVRNTNRGIEADLPCEFGTIVYLKTKKEREAGMVSGFHVLPETVKLRVEWGDRSTQEFHFPFELSTEPPPPKDK